MNAYRGEAWMRPPCRDCPERARDFGGCRCQAFALTGDAAATDPACALAPTHAIVEAARREAASPGRAPIHRGEPAGESAAARGRDTGPRIERDLDRG
jgi:pyrroloquinoline quinone biosynthesis protein E